MIKIHTVLCREGTMDNYAYILIDEATGISAVLDPSEAAPIIKKCSELAVTPAYILNNLTARKSSALPKTLTAFRASTSPLRTAEISSSETAKQKSSPFRGILPATFSGIFLTVKRFLPAICCLISALAAYLKARPNKCGNQS